MRREGEQHAHTRYTGDKRTFIKIVERERERGKRDQFVAKEARGREEHTKKSHRVSPRPGPYSVRQQADIAGACSAVHPSPPTDTSSRKT